MSARVTTRNMEQLTGTDTLLRLLTRPVDAAGLDVTPHRLTEVEWDVVLEQAAHHGVELVLYDRLRVADKSEMVPELVLAQLRGAYLGAAARNTVMLHHAAVILNALKAAGIEVIVLKGLYLVEHIYASIGLRTFGDLDLLVRKERLADALAAMQGLGYKLSTWYDPTVENTDIKHLPPLEKVDSPTVEVHWTILEEDEPFSIDTDGLWQRAIPAKAAGVEMLALGLEDLILHLSMHFTYQHRLRAGLRNLYDIAEVIRQNDSKIDWQQLVLTSREWGAERVTWLTFRLLERVTGLSVPEDVMRSLQSTPPDEQVVADALAQVLDVERAGIALTPDLANLPASAGLGAKLRLVWQRVFIPRRVLAREYNLEPGSIKIYGYYFVRLRDLWRRYRRAGLRLMTGEEGAMSGVDEEQANKRLRDWMAGAGLG